MCKPAVIKNFTSNKLQIILSGTFPVVAMSLFIRHRVKTAASTVVSISRCNSKTHGFIQLYCYVLPVSACNRCQLSTSSSCSSSVDKSGYSNKHAANWIENIPGWSILNCRLIPDLVFQFNKRNIVTVTSKYTTKYSIYKSIGVNGSSVL